MKLTDECEAWKTFALAYEVFIECVLEWDIRGMFASLKQMRAARATLLERAMAEAGGPRIEDEDGA